VHSNGGNLSASGAGTSMDGTLLIQLAQVNGINVDLRDDLDELIDTIGIAHEVTGVVMLRVYLGAQKSAIIGQGDLQPLVQVVVDSRYHEVNAWVGLN
jgi:hypothetical protein